MSSLTPTITLPGHSLPQRSPTAAPPDHFRVIAFTIDSYTLALPMAAIAKVIHCPPLYTPGLGHTGLIHLDRNIIRVLNLHSLIATPTQASPDNPSNIKTGNPDHQDPLFLLVARQTNGELCGIPVDTPPDLLELERSQVQPLPQSLNPNDIIALASLVAILPPSQESPDSSAPSESTILLLDLDKAVAKLHPQLPATPKPAIT